MKTNIKVGDSVIHPDFGREPLKVQTVEEFEGYIYVDVLQPSTNKVKQLFANQCVVLYKEKNIAQQELENSNLSEEEQLQKQLTILRAKKKQEEQTAFDEGIYAAFLRCRDQKYIIERSDTGHHITLRVISNVRISGILGKPINPYDNRGFKEHNLTVNCDVHEQVRLFRGNNPTEKNEGGYGTTGYSGKADFSFEVYTEIGWDENFIQAKDYPCSEKNYITVMTLVQNQVNSLYSFFENNKELVSAGD